MTENIRKLIMRYGKCEVLPSGRMRGTYSTICQGCGKKIWSTDDCDIDYIITRRNTALFLHHGCIEDFGTKKILWTESENGAR